MRYEDGDGGFDGGGLFAEVGRIQKNDGREIDESLLSNGNTPNISRVNSLAGAIKEETADVPVGEDISLLLKEDGPDVHSRMGQDIEKQADRDCFGAIR